MTVSVREAKRPDETEAQYQAREAAHVAEAKKRIRSIQNIRAMVEARFGKPK